MSLEGRSLTCVRSERLVFSRLSFGLRAGEALLVRGPNGSGKSSLLRIVAGLLAAAEGELLWEGAPVAEDPDAHRARLHYVGHLDAVKAALTVAENLAFWAEFKDRPWGEMEGLARFGLDHLGDVPARLLSAGQRRRLALARLVASPAPLWLLDEPTVSLDDEAGAALMAAIDAHRAAGGMVMVASHVELGLARAEVLELGVRRLDEEVA